MRYEARRGSLPKSLNTVRGFELAWEAIQKSRAPNVRRPPYHCPGMYASAAPAARSI